MPVSCTIDGLAGIVYTTIGGAPEVDEVIRCLDEVVNDPEFRPGLDGIADLRESELLPSSAEVKRIAEALQIHRSRILPSRTAIVVSSDASFGTARMYEGWGGETGIETKVFRDMEEARRWIEEGGHSGAEEGSPE